MSKPDSQLPTSDNRSLHRITLFLAIFCFALSSGFLSGRLLSENQSPITFAPDTRRLVPVVRIKGVRNGLLHGEITGNARVHIGNQTLSEPGVFALDAGPILYNQVVVQVPPGAQFVASRRGSKYYAVDSSGGSRIAPQNRVYFATEKEAKAAGYKE